MLRWSTLAALVCGAVLLAPVTRVDAALNDTIVTGAASPYELVIIEVEGCTYCDVLRRDVMPAFNASPEARELPVRFVNIDAPEARLLELTEGPVTTVPTVLLVKGNREVGRAPGYMGPDGFFQSIKWMMRHAP